MLALFQALALPILDTIICVDKMPIFEPGLAELVAKNAKENRLAFTTEFVRLRSRSSQIITPPVDRMGRVRIESASTSSRR